MPKAPDGVIELGDPIGYVDEYGVYDASGTQRLGFAPDGSEFIFDERTGYPVVFDSVTGKPVLIEPDYNMAAEFTGYDQFKFYPVSGDCYHNVASPGRDEGNPYPTPNITKHHQPSATNHNQTSATKRHQTSATKCHHTSATKQSQAKVTVSQSKRRFELLFEIQCCVSCSVQQAISSLFLASLLSGLPVGKNMSRNGYKFGAT